MLAILLRKLPSFTRPQPSKSSHLSAAQLSCLAHIPPQPRTGHKEAVGRVNHSSCTETGKLRHISKVFMAGAWKPGLKGMAEVCSCLYALRAAPFSRVAETTSWLLEVFSLTLLSRCKGLGPFLQTASLCKKICSPTGPLFPFPKDQLPQGKWGDLVPGLPIVVNPVLLPQPELCLQLSPFHLPLWGSQAICDPDSLGLEQILLPSATRKSSLLLEDCHRGGGSQLDHVWGPWPGQQEVWPLTKALKTSLAGEVLASHCP